jgi:hypothetical protein
MFYLKDLGSLLDSIHEIDPDANPMAMIKFTLPDGSTAKATYVHESMDGEVGSQGTIVLDADDIHTEFDSMQYAIDGIEGLVRQRRMSSEPEESPEAEEPEAEEEQVDYASLSADDLANEVDYYLRNNYPGANWVSDKELSDGSLALMIDWGNNNVEEIKPALKSQFGDRISFINTPPEAGGVGIIVNALERTPVNEAIDFDNELGDYYSDLRAEEAEQDDEAENYQEMTEEGVQGVLNKLGLTVVNKWYDGNRSRPVFDCQKGNGETICVWTEPPYEAKVWFKDREPGNNRFTEDIITLDSLESELNDLLDEISPTEEELNAAAEKISAPDYHAEGAYEDLTYLGNDFEAVELYKDIKAVCDIAGKPALAEAVIKLHKAYHPVMESNDIQDPNDIHMQLFASYLKRHGITDMDQVNDPVKLERILNDMRYYKCISPTGANKIWTTVMSGSYPTMEAVEKPHIVPRDMAVAFNDYVADTYYTRPETHDQLKASEFEHNWKWLDDYAQYVLPVWEKTHSGKALWDTITALEEEGNII